MKAYILKSDDETIAVVAEKELHKFYVSIRTAIADHYCCDKIDDVSMNDIVGFISFTADLIENGEETIRDFYLQQTTIY